MKFLVLVAGFIAELVGLVWLLVAPAGNAGTVLPLMLGGFAVSFIAGTLIYVEEQL